MFTLDQILLKNNPIKFLLNIFGSSKKTICIVAIYYLVFGFYFGSWRTERTITHDTTIYYEYLTAAFMFNDLSFKFAEELPNDFDGDIWLETGLDGERFPKMTMGVAIMLSPFYLIASGLNSIFEMGSYGYSSFFQFFIFLAALFYAIAGLLLQRKILLNFFKEGITSLTILIIAIGTNYAYYIVGESGMSHVYSFFLFSAFIYYTIKWHSHPKVGTSILLGICFGLIVLVRPSNGLIGLIPLLYGLSTLSKEEDKFKFILSRYKNALLVLFCSALIISMQFIFWKYSTGKWFVYGYDDEGFFFNDPKIFEGFFSFRKGFFVYTPLIVLAFIGLFIRNKKLRVWKMPAMVFLCLNAYVVFSWWCWWYGGGYSQRALIESIAVLSLFLASTLEFIASRTRPIKMVAGILLAFFVVQNSIQMIQYNRGILHWHGMTAEAYKNIFFKLRYPENYSDYIVEPDYDEAIKGNR